MGVGYFSVELTISHRAGPKLDQVPAQCQNAHYPNFGILHLFLELLYFPKFTYPNMPKFAELAG